MRVAIESFIAINDIAKKTSVLLLPLCIGFYPRYYQEVSAIASLSPRVIPRLFHNGTIVQNVDYPVFTDI